MPDGFGTITGIDRTEGLVGAILDDGPALALPLGFAYRGDPPPPLSVCWFTDIGGGKFVCEGPTGQSRVLLHDDFTLVGAAPALGDTNWRLVGGTAPATLTVADTQGVQGVLTTAVLNNFTLIAKSENGVLAPEPPAALWYSARVAVGTAANATITTMQTRWGLYDDGAQDGVYFTYDTFFSPNWQINATLAGVTTTVTTATPGVSQSWVVLDIVLVAGVAAYAWVDGDGPYPVTGVPTTAVAFEPIMFVLTRAAAVRAAMTDWVHLEWFAEASDRLNLDTLRYPRTAT